MKRIVILARNFSEAFAYCKDQKIQGTFAKSSKQVHIADHIIELPGFAERRDGFALAAARDSRLRFNQNVEYTHETEWAPPAPVVEEADEELQALEQLNKDLDFGDLTDPDVLERLKAALNEVGLTLKKLPAKKQDAPVVDAPVEF